MPSSRLPFSRARMSLSKASSAQKVSASAEAARTLVKYELVLDTIVKTVPARASTPVVRERGSIGDGGSWS